MKKIKNFFSKIFTFLIDNLNWLVFGLLTIGLLIYIGFNYFLFIRLWISLKSLVVNIWFYFVNLFLKTEKSFLPYDYLKIEYGSLVSLLPKEFDIFLLKLKTIVYHSISKYNLSAFFTKGFKAFRDFLFWLNLIGLFVPILIIYDYLYYLPKENLGLLDKSKPLEIYEKFYNKIFVPIKFWILSFIHWVRSTWYIKLTLYGLFFFAFGFVFLLVDFFSWYFYFVSFFDFLSIYKFFVVVFIDLYKFLTFFPLWVYLILAYFIYDKIRINKAYKKLERYENYNKGFIANTGLVVFINGVIGAGKTELMTDMMISNDEIYKTELLGILKEIDNLFPYFNFRALEEYIENGIKKNKFVNRSQVIANLSDMFTKFEETEDKQFFFNYEFDKYSLYADVGLSLENLFDCLIDYGQAYFTYIIAESYLLTNYAVRSDSERIETNHFKLFSYDYFRSDFTRKGSLSKNIDFDALRFGVKMIKDNKNSFIVDNCIIGITEIDKERGNQFDLEGLERNSTSANLKNDRFNVSLKLGRHPATIRYRTFFKFYCDGQRVGSVNSDLIELSNSHIRVNDKGDFHISLFGFWLAPFICEFLLSTLDKIYYRFRYSRSDNTLVIRAVKWLKSKIHIYYNKRLNTFGFWSLDLSVSDGSSRSSETRKQSYFLMKKKIHNSRYSSDSYSLYFYEKYKNADYGFKDVPSFESIYATKNELDSQHSYFIKSLDESFFSSYNMFDDIFS